MPAVEEHGVEPIPPGERTGTWLDLSRVLVAFLLNPLMYVLGALAVTVGGLTLWWAVVTFSLGQLVSYALLAIVARLGVDYGLTGQIGMRAFLGYWGARLLSSGYRTIVATYWFAAQAIAAAFGVQALLAGIADIHVGVVPTAVVLAAVQVVLAVLGFDVLRWVTKVVLPCGVVFVVVILVLYLTSTDSRFAVERVLRSPDQEFTWLGFATFFTIIVGSTFTFVTNVADFTRYTRSRRDAWIGLIAASVPTTALTTFIGGYAAVATGDGNPFIAAPELTSSVVLLVVLLVAILVQSTGVNVINAYTVGLSLLNTAPRLGRLAATAIGGAAAIGLSALPELVTEAQTWILHVSNLAFPITGVVLAELLGRMGGTVIVDDLYRSDGRYRYVAGVSVAALISIGAGVAAYYAVPDEWVKAVWGVGIAAVVQLALGPVQQRRLRPEPAAVPQVAEGS
jgi:purine-cytosine permease-like protein